MKPIIALFGLLVFVGCLSGDRHYYIHNHVAGNSSLEQTIKVDAVATHPITIDTEVPVGP